VTNHRYDQPMTPVATPKTIIHSMLFPIRQMLPPLPAFDVPTLQTATALRTKDYEWTRCFNLRAGRKGHNGEICP
jgi:hypothetical protein